ncbi:MAG: TonB-dependent receptor, partial [Candidatus Marinimicrobia bacterium]|nr:TonB-dependent receptor [Candidatus Neomarinimicrobiota bacterium]
MQPLKKLIFIIVSILLAMPVFGGISGTISGHVVDGSTKDPLVGVQVIIDGSDRGAVCDASGTFILVNVPPGHYDLRFEMIGYSKQIVTGVPVIIDLQTQIKVELEAATLSGETVIVESQTKDLTRQITSTTRFISPQQLDNLPVQNYQELVEAQPGVAAGHVRGGRKSELVYLVDGMPIQNIVDGKIGTELPNTSIIDISVQTGGFTAEYGNAMSGVVNILTKEGQDKFFLKAQAHLLDYSQDPRPFHPEGHAYEYKYDLAVGGPILSSGASYFLSGDVHVPSSRLLQEQFGVRKMGILDPDSTVNFNISGKLSTYFLNQTLKLT